jgi:hypothetical protein
MLIISVTEEAEMGVWWFKTDPGQKLANLCEKIKQKRLEA